MNNMIIAVLLAKKENAITIRPGFGWDLQTGFCYDTIIILPTV